MGDTMEEVFINSEYGKTAVYNGGCYSQYPIIYVHGGPGHPDHSILNSKLSESFNVITYDQFGCGISAELPPGSYDIDKYTSQLNDVIEAFSYRGAILYGSSWGTMVIAAYLERYGSEKVKCIILSGPFLDSKYHNELSLNRISSLPEPYSSELKRCIDEGITGEELFVAQRPYMYEWYAYGDDEDSIDFYWCDNGRSYKELWGDMELICSGSAKDYDYSHAFDDINVPVIFKMGDHDIMEVSKIIEISESIPDCKIIVYQECGHVSGGPESLDALIPIIKEKVSKDYVLCDKPTDIVYLPFSTKKYDINKIRDQDYRIKLNPDNKLPTLFQISQSASNMTLKDLVSKAIVCNKNGSSLKEVDIYRDLATFRARGMYSLRTLDRTYKRIDPDRVLIISPSGIESYCCEELSRSKEKNRAYSMERCPYCGCEAQHISPDRDYTDEDLDNLIMLFDVDKNKVKSVQDYVNLRALGATILRKLQDGPFKDLDSIPRYSYDKGLTDNVGNVTGTLAYSSIGLESVCCQEFKDKLEGCRSYNGGTAMIFVFKGIESDGSFTHECPFCHEPLRRTPRSR